MKKRYLKLCSMLLATAMVMTACGSTTTTQDSKEPEKTSEVATEKTSEAVKEEEPKEIVDITVMVYDRGREYTNGNTLLDNEFTRWINENLEPQGVHVTYVAVPRSGADDKVNLMLTGGTAPDVIRTYDLARVLGYAQDGGLCDLTDYMDMLSEDYLSQAVLEVGQVDGRQYGLPGVYSYGQKSKEMFLRQDLVEGVGMEMPTNKEELIEVLYAIKDAYPDIIPFGFGGKNTNGNYENFIQSYTSRANERDNYIYEATFTRILKPGHKDGLRQLNQFVLDGIIDANFVLDTDNAKYDENIANGNYALVMDGSADCVDDAYETASDPNYHMVEVNCLENLDGSYEVYSSGVWDHMTYVPKTAEDRIEAVMTYLAFVSDEENSINIRLGLEGLGYEITDGKYVEYSRDVRLANGTSGDPSDNSLLWGNYSYKTKTFLEDYMASNPEVPQDAAESRIEHRYSEFYHCATPTEILDADQYSALLNELIVEFVFNCMCAPEGQFDAVYEAQYQVLLDNHLQDLLDERAAWYDANIAK